MTVAGAGASWHPGNDVQAALDRVEAILHETVVTQDGLLCRLATYLLSLGGKRLRSALVLLASGEPPYADSALKAAAAVELLHLASLYHDDVMDRATRRRGGETANVVWGNELAVLAGSHLFARAVRLLTGIGDDVIEAGARAGSRLCAGQLREALCAYDVDVSADERLAILELKTATLFELAAQLGARLAKRAPLEVDALKEYGRQLGIAFQLADDGLDLSGDPRTTGKNAGNDLREGIYSLPVVRLLNGSDAIGHRCRDLLTRLEVAPEEVNEVLGLIRESRAANEAHALALNHAHRAVAALQVLEPSPHRASLEALASFAVERSA